jgi:flagellin
VQTAEGGLNEVSNILIRLRELGVQAASDTIGDEERSFINKEFSSLKEELDRIATSTNFNGIKLLTGDDGGKDELVFQVGARGGEDNRIKYNVAATDVRTSSLDIDDINVLQRDDAADSLRNIDRAINKVNGFRSSLGALQNRLNSSSNSIGISVENLSEARSRIADTDVAVETSNLVKNTILQSAGIAVLSQANSLPSNTLKLL